MPQLRWGAATDAGRVRAENEDTFVAETMVFAVADGMGGHQAGEVASALAASIVRDRFATGAVGEEAAAAVVAEANAAIHGAARANAAQSGMGTTLTALALMPPTDNDAPAPVDGDRIVLLNIGDSRTYRYRTGRLQRMTVDHSYVQELVAAGHITIEEARTHPRRNIVTRALGIEPIVRADIWTLPIARGDRFLLASDGLVDEVPDAEIQTLVSSIDDPQQLADELVATANRHGGRDNVTVIIVDVVDGAEPPDPTDELPIDPAWADEIPGVAAWSTDRGVDADPPTVAAEVVPEAAPIAAAATLPAPAVDTPATLAQPITVPPTLPAPVLAPNTATIGIDKTPKPKRPKRRFSIGAFLFTVVAAAIVIITLTVIAVHARSGYFVGFEGDTVVVYKGQRDNVLWFEPTVNLRSERVRGELDQTMIDAIDKRPTFDSAEEAAEFITEQVVPTTTTSTTAPETTTTAPTTTNTSGETTTTISGP